MLDLPRVDTERLELRVPVPEDAEAMAAFVDANREHFAPWDPIRSDEYFTADYWRVALEGIVRNATDGASIQFVIRRRGDDTIIGQCTFSGIVRGAFQATYLGYGLDYRVVGQGVMHEALEVAIRHCFAELNLHRIMANYMPENERSGKLLARLGFVIEGHARNYLFLAGEWRDHVLTSLTNDKWKNTLR